MFPSFSSLLFYIVMTISSNLQRLDTMLNNGALMDTDKDSLGITPTSTLSASWIPKSTPVLTITKEDAGVTTYYKQVEFIPVQVVADKSMHINFTINVSFGVSTTCGAEGTSSFTVGFPDFAGINPLNIQVTCDREVNGENPDAGYFVVGNASSTDLNSVKVNLCNLAKVAKTYVTTAHLTIYGQMSNTDIGYGKLFPSVNIA